VSQVRIITALSRWENLDFYLGHLADKNILWHPIVEGVCEELNRAWILPFYCDNSHDKGNVFYRRLNAFIQEYPIFDDDYYFFMNDDDWMADDVPALLSAYTEDVIFAGMLRGNHPVPGHPISPLMPYPGVRAGSIGVEQMILKGRILRTIQFDIQSGMADGIMAEFLQTQHPVRYAPELVMYFNYLEQGRW